MTREKKKKSASRQTAGVRLGNLGGLREGVCFEEGGRGGGVDVKQDLVDGGKSFALLLPFCC